MQSGAARVSFHYTKNCFVNLPRGWTSKIQREKVAALQVQSEHGVLYTTWAGGTSSSVATGELEEVELNGLFAAKQNVSHGDEVVVSVLPSVPMCSRVFVEPLSPDDWEILELHASMVENNLLNQVRVVWPGQIFPIWIQNNICVFIKIGVMEPAAKCSLLEQDSEVIVAPVSRYGKGGARTKPANHVAGNAVTSPPAGSEPANQAPEQKESHRSKEPASEVRSPPGGSSVAQASPANHVNGAEDAGTEGSVIKDADVPSMEIDETNAPPASKLRQMLGYLSSWLVVGGEEASQGASDAAKEESAHVYGSELLKNELECALRVQSLTNIADLDLATGLDTEETASAEAPDVSDEKRSLNLLSSQPTNVFISYETYLSSVDLVYRSAVCQHPGSFLAYVCKIPSPMEREEAASRKKPDAPTAPTAPRRSRPPDRPWVSGDAGADKEIAALDADSAQSFLTVVRVIVVDHNGRFAVGNNTKVKATWTAKLLLGHVAISDLLRRQLGLEVTAKVKLQALTSDKKEETLKEMVFHPLFTLPSEFSKDMIQVAVDNWLAAMSSPCQPLVLCQGTLLSCPIKPDFQGEFLVTFPSSSRVKPSPSPTTVQQTSYYLLTGLSLSGVKVTLNDQLEVGQVPLGVAKLPYRSSEQFDPEVPRADLERLGAVSDLAVSCLQHTEVCLSLGPLPSWVFGGQRGLRQGAMLLTGARGTGKSTLARALCRQAALGPTLAHVTVVDCKPLRGKRLESVRKIFERVFNEAAWREPSVILLDDLDHVTAAPSGPEQEVSPEAQYYSRVAHVIKDIIQIDIDSGKKIFVLATAKSKTSLHASLVNSRGVHYFQEVLEINPPTPADRVAILKALLLAKPSVSPESVERVDLRALAGRTEGFVAGDLSMMCDRAVHAHHMAALSHNTWPAHRQEEVTLDEADVDAALKGFTPAALRNVTLHKPGDLGWRDLGGLLEVKQTLLETLEWPSKYPRLFASCPLRLRSGLLLYGAPGTGKTLLAGIVAKECGLNFISIKGPELLSKYIGASEQAVRETFARARSAKPCILFFDELDSLAPRRGHDSTGVTDRVVNQLLTQLDGVEGLEGVYVLGATSRPDLIDPALLRPGRLDKALHCPLPTPGERVQILAALTRGMTLADDVDLTSLGDRCEHLTGADLKALLYNAQLDAIHGLMATGQAAVAPTSDGDSALTAAQAVHIVSLEEGLSEDGLSPQLLEKYQVEPSGEQTESGRPGRSKGDTAVTIQMRHLVTAAGTMNPSVSAADRQKYRRIYESFVASRGGNFSDQMQTAGQRTTLA